MRLFLVVEVIVGALFIIFALILQTPPKSSVPIGLIVVGGLTLINSLFGCVGSCYKRSMLTIYLIIGTVLTLAQAVLVFYMFGKPGTIANNIAEDDSSRDLGSAGNIRRQILWVRWILLGFVIAEIVGLLTALILRCCVDPDGHYGNFSDEEARYNTQMNTMPNSSTTATGAGAGKYESQSGSIASKYGMYKK
eukprot:CAMPEP_0206148948 /NCGR_PEP_ID=MMETSP1473-20131121/37523_1 /ASSEMBLY_ACC=CAM_ASM_001109 /TAXON_ID=1461547 /ORGANISM="Stichococcus sp, Strain RCC1054" /LENGTH=192 /DNA_ID=CAMNT_0053546385 /DNA_START=279 /DNA_END=857 /DNA_ORIENTATION=+